MTMMTMMTMVAMMSMRETAFDKNRDIKGKV
jgi:hypothetical protein